MDRVQLVNEFIQKTKTLNEVEYGDFKRKVGSYLMRLEEGLKSPSTEVNEVLGELKSFVVYVPNGDIEFTRAKSLEMAEKLKKNL